MKYSAYTWLWLCLLLAPLGLPGQAPRFERVVEYGTQSFTLLQADMVLDGDDNLYVAGIFEEFVCFADTCLVATDQEHANIYVISFDPQGQMRWVRLIEGPSKDIVTQLGVRHGQLVVSGFFSLEMPWGDTTLYARSSGAFWGELGLVDGAWGQIHQIDGRRQEETQSMAITQDGQVWLGGFSDSDTLRAEGVTLVADTSGTRDLWLAGYNAEGQLETFRLLTSAADGWAGRVRHLAVDQTGNQYLEGTFEANLLIGQDTLWSTTNTWNQADNYLVKVAPQGEVVWARVGTPISAMSLHNQNQLIVTGNTNQSMTWGDSTLEAGYFLIALGADGAPEWVSQSPVVPPGLFLVTDMTISGNQIYSHMMHHGPADFPDTSYYVEDKVLILRHNAFIGNLDWYKEFGEEDVFELAGNLLVRNDRSLVSAGSFHSYLQNFTYFDSVQVLDQYPFSSSAWHYIGFTAPDTLPSTSLADTSLETQWTAYPNPVRGRVHVSGFLTDQPVRIEVFTLEGKIALRDIIHPTDGRGTVYLESIMPGIYLLKVQTHRHTQLFRLIKQP